MVIARHLLNYPQWLWKDPYGSFHANNFHQDLKVLVDLNSHFKLQSFNLKSAFFATRLVRLRLLEHTEDFLNLTETFKLNEVRNQPDRAVRHRRLRHFFIPLYSENYTTNRSLQLLLKIFRLLILNQSDGRTNGLRFLNICFHFICTFR